MRNKKRVIVNAGLCLRTHAKELLCEYCDKLIKRKINIVNVDTDNLIFETENVLVQMVTYTDKPKSGEWDETFGFEREIGIYLRKGHRLDGFSGGIISYIEQEETRKLQTPL
jgi:hypothetical protein